MICYLCLNDSRIAIVGWDQGCLGMKKGEVRKLVIPADEGYGAAGFPAWGIPPGGDCDHCVLPYRPLPLLK
jgi:FKBP-type peptidyl-prolyl cis-trans isomerase